MNRLDLARLIDHSLLRPDTTEEEIVEQAEVVRQWGIGFFCVHPSYVSLAVRALRGSDARVVSVVGFPLAVIGRPSRSRPRSWPSATAQVWWTWS